MNKIVKKNENLKLEVQTQCGSLQCWKQLQGQKRCTSFHHPHLFSHLRGKCSAANISHRGYNTYSIVTWVSRGKICCNSVQQMCHEFSPHNFTCVQFSWKFWCYLQCKGNKPVIWTKRFVAGSSTNYFIYLLYVLWGWFLHALSKLKYIMGWL